MNPKHLFALVWSVFLFAPLHAAEATHAPAGQLAQPVQSFVDADEIVGAELLLIHNRQTVLHRWKSR